MFRHRTHKKFPLHKALLEHRPEEVVGGIIGGTSEDLTKLDGNKRNLLQLAAARGYIEAILWLLYVGVDVNYSDKLIREDQLLETKEEESIQHLHESQKTALYLAVEYKQWLAAQVLLICGADKNEALDLARQTNNSEMIDNLFHLTIDRDVICAVLYWVISNYHKTYKDHLLELIQPQILSLTESNDAHFEKSISEKEHLITIKKEKNYDHILSTQLQNDLFGLIELAAQKNLTSIAKTLFEINQKKIRTQEGISSFGFWAAKNDNDDLYRLISHDNNHVEMVLRQLNEAKDQRFEKYFDNATEEQQELYLNSIESNVAEEKMTPKQQKIFKAANFFKTEQLNCLYRQNKNAEKNDSDEISKADRDYLTVLTHAKRTKNYVVFDAINNLIDNKILFKYVLQQNERDLFFSFMFSQDHYPYELIHLYPMQINAILNEIENPMENRGLLYRMIFQGTYTVHDFREKSEINTQLLYFQKMQVSEDQFVTMYHQCEYQRNDIVSTKQAFEIKSTHEANRMIEQARWFGFPLFDYSHYNLAGLNLDNKTKLSREVFQLDSTMIQGPAHIILSFLQEKELAKLASVSKSFNKLCFSKQRILINHFLQHLKDEINQQPRFSHLNISKNQAWFVIIFLFTALGLAAASAMLGITNGKQRAIRKAMRRGITYLKEELLAPFYCVPPFPNRFCNDDWGYRKKPSWCFPPFPPSECADYPIKHYDTLNCQEFMDPEDENLCGDIIDLHKGENAGFQGCYDLCQQLEGNRGAIIGEGLGVGFTGLFFLLLVCNNAIPQFINIIKKLFKGSDRFNNVSLMHFSNDLQNEARHLFNLLQGHEGFNLTLNSEVGTIIENLNEIKKDIKVSTTSFHFFHQSPEVNAATPLLEQREYSPLQPLSP